MGEWAPGRGGALRRVDSKSEGSEVGRGLPAVDGGASPRQGALRQRVGVQGGSRTEVGVWGL